MRDIEDINKRPSEEDRDRYFRSDQVCQNASLLAETFSPLSASDALRLDVRDTLHGVFAFVAAAKANF